MLRSLLAFALGALVVVAGAGGALAERRVALVIGNQDYKALPALEKAVADAESYAGLFRDQGFERVIFRKDVTRQEMDEALAEFVDAIEPGDTAVFVYAGHGWSDGTQNFLIGIDAPATGSESFLRRISLPIENGADGIIDEVQAKGAALKIAIIDACRDNPFGAKDGTRSIGMARGFNRMTAPPQGTFAVFSAGAGQTALDRLSEGDADPNGVFTRIFVPLLKSNMTLLDATKAAQAQVYELAKSVGHEQQPAFYDETRGNSVCLAGTCVPSGTTVASADPAAAPQVMDIEEQYWIAVRESDNVELLTTYTDKYPEGRYAEIARVKIAALQVEAYAGIEAALGLSEQDYLDINAVLMDAKLLARTGGSRYTLDREAIRKFQEGIKVAATGYLDRDLLKRFRDNAPEVRDKWETAVLGDDNTKRLRVIRALQELGHYRTRRDDGSYYPGTWIYEDEERAAIRAYQASIDNLEAGDRIDSKAYRQLMEVSLSTDSYANEKDISGQYYSQTFGDWGLIRSGDVCWFMTIATDYTDQLTISAPALVLKFEDVTREGNNYTWRLWLNAATNTYVNDPWNLSVDGRHVLEGMMLFTWSNISQNENVVARLRSGQEAVVEYNSMFTEQTETARYSLSGFTRAYNTAKNDCVFGK